MKELAAAAAAANGLNDAFVPEPQRKIHKRGRDGVKTRSFTLPRGRDVIGHAGCVCVCGFSQEAVNTGTATRGSVIYVGQ